MCSGCICALQYRRMPHWVQIVLPHLATYIKWRFTVCTRVSMCPGRVLLLQAKCQLMTAGWLLLSTEAQQRKTRGGKEWEKRRARDQVSSGNRSRENEEVKGDVSLVSRPLNSRARLRVCLCVDCWLFYLVWETVELIRSFAGLICPIVPVGQIRRLQT